MQSTKELSVDKSQKPQLETIINLAPITWINSERKLKSEWPEFPISIADMNTAESLWDRFAPFFAKAYPETLENQGYIESPLLEIEQMKSVLNQDNPLIEGRLFLKCDNALPIAGSIKARGGFFEVLLYAEQLAIKAGLLKITDDYSVFTSDRFKQFFSNYKIGVGSTGNLGLSIGLIGAKLGFKVSVYMSDDAKTWKKNILRSIGVTVLEFAGDFSEAILEGRTQTLADPNAYFVDDENSEALFLGYTVGGLRIAKQLEDAGVVVDSDHPLFVYSPCGVGGSPGGTAFGLKQIYGNNVHCFFVEPTHSPAVLTGLITGKMSEISVQDIGIDNKTEADGLAVGRASAFATEISKQLIGGIYTIEDHTLFTLLAQLQDSEGISLEPSATAGLVGPQRIAQSSYAEKLGLNMKQATHVVWATGGDRVPEEERKAFYKRGKTGLKS